VVRNVKLESILQDFYGVKKVFLKNPRIANRYEVAAGSKYHIYECLTSSGKKAYSKLIGLLYDLESILGGSFKARPWVMKLHETANMGDFTGIPENAENTCLDSILMSRFRCKKVFLKKPKICGYYLGGEPDPDYEYFTRAGGRAYGRLVSLVENLAELFGNNFDSHDIVSILDDIATKDY
jgi:hypothetical protein